MPKVNVPKKTAKQDEVVFVDSESVTEKVLPIIEEEPVEVVVSAKTAPLPDKMVKIKPRVTQTVHIGGENYYLVKGVQQSVPENVKDILARGDKLLPL